MASILDRVQHNHTTIFLVASWSHCPAAHGRRTVFGCAALANELGLNGCQQRLRVPRGRCIQRIWGKFQHLQFKSCTTLGNNGIGCKNHDASGDRQVQEGEFATRGIRLKRSHGTQSTKLDRQAILAAEFFLATRLVPTPTGKVFRKHQCLSETLQHVIRNLAGNQTGEKPRPSGRQNGLIPWPSHVSAEMDLGVGCLHSWARLVIFRGCPSPL